MKTLTSVQGGYFVWTRPNIWRREYELESANGVIGHLTFPSIWKEIAEAEIAGQRWSFDRSGFFRHQVLIWKAGVSQPFGVFHPARWHGGGTLEMVDGISYRFKSNFWQSRLEVRDSGNEALLVFHERGFFRQTVEIDISPRAGKLENLPLLLALGMYLHLLQESDAAVIVAVAASS